MKVQLFLVLLAASATDILAAKAQTVAPTPPDADERGKLSAIITRVKGGGKKAIFGEGGNPS
jgi:hypothetical protein